MWQNTSGCHNNEIIKRLKKQLANFACKCKVCEKYNVTSMHEDICMGEKSSDKPFACAKFNHSVTQCPGCYVAYNLIQTTNKSYKDEETDVNIAKACADKGMQKSIDGIHKTTSMTKKNVTYSESVIADIYGKEMFEDDEKPVTLKCSDEKLYKERYCLCLESFIDSIRPPLKYRH